MKGKLFLNFIVLTLVFLISCGQDSSSSHRGSKNREAESTKSPEEQVEEVATKWLEALYAEDIETAVALSAGQALKQDIAPFVKRIKANEEKLVMGEKIHAYVWDNNMEASVGGDHLSHSERITSTGKFKNRIWRIQLHLVDGEWKVTDADDACDDPFEKGDFPRHYLDIPWNEQFNMVSLELRVFADEHDQALPTPEEMEDVLAKITDKHHFNERIFAYAYLFHYFPNEEYKFTVEAPNRHALAIIEGKENSGVFCVLFYDGTLKLMEAADVHSLGEKCKVLGPEKTVKLAAPDDEW